MKMFLTGSQNNFYIIVSSYVEGYVQKNSSLSFMSSVGFQASKIWMFFGYFTAELVWKSFPVRDNFLEPPVFLFYNSLLNALEESRDFGILISWVLGTVNVQKCFRK